MTNEGGSPGVKNLGEHSPDFPKPATCMSAKRAPLVYVYSRIHRTKPSFSLSPSLSLHKHNHKTNIGKPNKKK